MVEKERKTTGNQESSFSTPEIVDEVEVERTKNEEPKPRLNERTILKLQEAFSLFDHDYDGKLTLHQTATVIRACGLGLTERHIAEILAEAPSAKIDFGTFLTSMANHIKNIKDDRADAERAAILGAFTIYDDAGVGRIKRRHLTRILTRVGETINKHEVDELLDDLGYGEVSADDEIEYEELIEALLEDY